MTFRSVVSQWSDKGRVRLQEGKDRVTGSGSGLSFQDVKIEGGRMLALEG